MTSQIDIKRYSKDYQTALFELIAGEGEDWIEYYGPSGRDKYLKAVESSVTYIAFDEGVACGYIRARDDAGLCAIILDLLVRKTHRGKQIGRMLIEQIVKDFPNQKTYVMSGVDPYYQKLGYHKEGSIFKVGIK